MKTIPYGRQSISKKDIRGVAEILEGDWITQGPAVARFEEQFAKAVDSRWAVSVSSGTAALHLACLAQGLKPSDEVLVPAMTFVATANSVFYAGARPRLVDIDPETGNISLEDLVKKINRNTRGIIPVHFAGSPVLMDAIRKIAAGKNLFVIEDCCHALGARYQNQPLGSCQFSDLAVFSFHPVKHITTGEGGMITGRDPKYRDLLLRLRNHGITRDSRLFSNGESAGSWYYEQQELGFNYRLTDFQCALGLSQLKRLKQFVARRREIAQYYRKAFSDWPWLTCLDENPRGMSSYHLFVIRLNLDKLRVDRKVIFEALRKRRIGVQVHYIPLYYQPFYRKNLRVKPDDFPGAGCFYESCLSLPIYPDLSLTEQKRVIRILSQLLTRYQNIR